MTEVFRWLALFVLISNLSISTYYRRKARRATGTIERRSEGAALVLLRTLVTLPLALSIFGYILNPAWMAWSSVFLPESARMMGAAMGVLTVPFVLWVFRSIGSNVSETVLIKDNHELVTTGPYRWVRHPLYTAGLFLLGSIGLMAANGLIIALATLALVLILLTVIPREEAYLIGRFPEYTAYRSKTGQLVPRSFRGAV